MKFGYASFLHFGRGAHPDAVQFSELSFPDAAVLVAVDELGFVSYSIQLEILLPSSWSGEGKRGIP